MSEVRIAAEPRTEFGKGGARRTRRAGKIPAVLYGHGTEPRHIALPARDFAFAIRGGINTLLTVAMPEGDELALPKAIQRDPLKGTFEHVDLLLVRRGEKVTIELPITLTGEARPGGLVNQDLNSLTVEAEATNIPGGVEINVNDIEVGGHVSAGDVTLPSGVTLVTEPDALVVAVVSAPSAEAVEAELAGLEGEAGIEREAPQTPDSSS